MHCAQSVHCIVCRSTIVSLQSLHRLAVVVVWRSIMTLGDHVIINHICQDYSGVVVEEARRHVCL